MIFSSPAYLIFFAVLLFLVGALRRIKYQKPLLVAASYFFYAWWDYRFLLLLFVLSLGGYLIGRQVERQQVQRARQAWLVAGIVFALGILGFFKYWNFFISSLDALLHRFQVTFPLLNIVLPVGISFMVFEVVCYLVDIYRRDNKSADSFLDLALLVAFFPHLIAGPILKPRQFLPQLRRDIVITWDNLQSGISIFVLGLAKKILVANNMAMFADAVFANPHLYNGLTLWLGVTAYAIQIYADFSGYSEMAIGSAKCLGIEIPRNFNFPYISRNITEFWRRWHISLSTWLRDYLYIPLGGNRKGTRRQYLNLMITMLLGGLWHGASWNFVIWGGIHGAGLAAHKLYVTQTGGVAGRMPAPAKYLFAGVSTIVTLVFVLVGWVFFRAADFTISSYYVSKMFGLVDAGGMAWYSTQLFIILPFFVGYNLLGSRSLEYPRLNLSTFSGQLALFFVVLLILVLAPSESAPFIYFQF